MESMVKRPNSDFWRKKKVLITGHTGFKGGWLALWLKRLGAKIAGISLMPVTTPNLFTLARVSDGMDSYFGDIRDAGTVAAFFRKIQPEVVFHLAAQPLVRAGYRQPVETYATNVMGTVHILDALRNLASVRVAVIITTDKVYRNLEHPYPYRENDPLGGHDPYSAGKAAAELVTDSYREAFLRSQGVAVATARAGNVIGGGDWSEDRLIPDAVRAWLAGETLVIRHPEAVRPWQHVLEPLSGYLRLAEELWNNPALAAAYNFGPETSTAAKVREVITLAAKAFKDSRVEWGDGGQGPHEAGWLALEIAKSRAILGVSPLWPLQDTVGRTMRWYQQQYDGADAAVLCEQDIIDFEAGK